MFQTIQNKNSIYDRLSGAIGELIGNEGKEEFQTKLKESFL